MPLLLPKLTKLSLMKMTANVPWWLCQITKLSLAIGRRGQNVRLAAHLTGYRIDIKSASEFEAMEEAGQVDYAETDELTEE